MDAHLLAEMGCALALPQTRPPPPERARLADLMTRRDDLSAMLPAEGNRLKQARDALIRWGIDCDVKLLQRRFAKLDGEIAARLRAHAALAQAEARLRTVPGVGPLPEPGQLDRRAIAAPAGWRRMPATAAPSKTSPDLGRAGHGAPRALPRRGRCL